MSLLRIYGSVPDLPHKCQWALVNNGHEPVTGEGRLADLPRRVARIQLVLPAAQVLIMRARVPWAARRRGGSVLAFAVEEQTAVEPDANQVSWLGSMGDDDVLAVADKAGLMRWRIALDAAGIRGYEVHCETLLLPWAAGEWSFAWNGHEGFMRTGEFEGAATDCGDREIPPLSVRLMLQEADAHSLVPASIAIYTTVPDALPDVEAWTRELGIAVTIRGTWNWRRASPGAGIALAQEHRRWSAFSGTLARLRPAAAILGAVLAIQAAGLGISWTSLAREQRSLRQQMELRFRAAFPDAVAVADPALQMRRKLAEARHAAGEPDDGDFLPMIEKVMTGLKGLPPGGLRIVSYEGGRMTLEVAAGEEAAVRRIVKQLLQSGLSVDSFAAPKRAAGAPVVITVWAS
jgi:general secretion pathway protein L